MSRDICIYITHGGLSSIKGFARQYLNKNPSEQQLIAKYTNGYLSLYPSGEQYSYDDFVDLVSGNTIVRLLCDSNLGLLCGEEVQSAVQSLVKALKPQELLLFSSTPACTSDANQNYIPSLAGSPTKRAIATDRMQMTGIIKGEIPLLKPSIDNVETVKENEMTCIEKTTCTSTPDLSLTEQSLLTLSSQVDQPMIVAPPVSDPMYNHVKKPPSCLPQFLSWLFVSNRVSPDNPAIDGRVFNL